jgi:hypothetical protein
MQKEVESLLSSLPRMDATIVKAATTLVVSLESMLRAENALPTR